MSLLGDWNWWVPRWLDRVLPHVRAEVDDVATDDAQPSDEELWERELDTVTTR
jgi:RND superfamily putative drug exporter